MASGERGEPGGQGRAERAAGIPFDRVTDLLDLFFVPRRRSQPGAPPGTLVGDPGASETRIRGMAYGPDAARESELTTPFDFPEFRGDAAVVWLDVQGLADIEAIRALGKEFGLHQLALEDVLNVHQRAKFEAYPDHLYLVLRMPRRGDASRRTEQLSIFVGDGFVLTFQEAAGDCLDPIRERIRTAKGRIRGRRADYLAYAIVDAVVDQYFPLLEAMGERLEAVEDEVVSTPSRASVRRIHATKRELLALRRAVWPLRDALNGFQRDPSELIEAETRVYLRDCADHAFQLIDLIETYREIGFGLMDVYLSSLGNRTNEIMKVLTIFAAIFIPLTFIAGVYGMNFDPNVSPWNMPELEWRYGYPFALGVMAAVAGGLLWYFGRRGWIGGG